MHRRDRGFSLVEVLIAVAISAIVIAATWMVVAGVLRGDDDNRLRVQLQMDAASALRKISDLLKMAGPTGNVGAGQQPGDYPTFALDQSNSWGKITNRTDLGFLDSTNYQTLPAGAVNPIIDDVVGHLAPSTDTQGYYGMSNEIAFQLPRPAPWYQPGTAPAGKPDNPLDNTGVPVSTAGATTWGVTPFLYQYYTNNGGASVADRQTDVYAIVLVPTTSLEKLNGIAVPGANQLELREFSTAPNRYLIRKTVLATDVERILFTSSSSTAAYYATGNDPTSGAPYTDGSLGNNQLRVQIWMWKNAPNKHSGEINAFRASQSITVNLRSVGENQVAGN